MSFLDRLGKDSVAGRVSFGLCRAVVHRIWQVWTEKENSSARQSRTPPPAKLHRIGIDLRRAEAFERGHAPWTVNIPVDQLEERAYELPPPGVSRTSAMKMTNKIQS